VIPVRKIRNKFICVIMGKSLGFFIVSVLLSKREDAATVQVFMTALIW